jgi:6-pyruvoyltetrahydropterin/6-carboxytetrahydropterin synthase
MMLITRRAEFSASHRCYNPNLPEQQNRDLYGESASSHGHGHNYMLEVTLDGSPDPLTGMVVDLKLLKQIIQERVIDPMDHRHLNYEVPPFDRIIPTLENLAGEIWSRLEPALQFPNARLHNVRLYETADLYVDSGGTR